MIDPTINETEEEVVSQPIETTGEEPKKTGEEPKKQPEEEQDLFELKDGSQVKVPSSASDKFQKEYPDSTLVLRGMQSGGKKPMPMPQPKVEEVEVSTLKNPTKIVGDDGEVGEVKVDVTQDDLNNVEDLLIQNDIYPLAISSTKQAEIDQAINTGMGKNVGLTMSADLFDAEIEEYAKQNRISTEDAAYVIREKKTAEKLDELYKKDQKKLDALAKAYSEKNNIDYDVSKSLFQKVYDQAFETKNKLDVLNQSAITAAAIIEKSPKNKNGDADLDEETYKVWQSASNTAAQTQYAMIQDRIARGELDQALEDTKKLKSFLWEKANVESHHSYNKGVGVSRLEYARKNSSYADALAAKIQYNMGNYDEAKRLEQKARDNGAYEGMEKLEQLQKRINETKDEKERERLQKEFQQEYQTRALESVGGLDLQTGYKQPDPIATSTPTAESQKMGMIVDFLETPFRRMGEIAKTGIELMISGGEDIGNEFKKIYYNATTDRNTTSKERENPDVLNITAGVLKIGMGLSAFTAKGAATFFTFEEAQKNKYTKAVLDNTLMWGSAYVTPTLIKMGYDEKTAANRGLNIDIATAILLHGTYNIVKGKVKTNSTYKKIQEQIKNGTIDETVVKDLLNSVDPKQRNKIIRKIANDYKNSPLEVKKELGESYAKVYKLIASKKEIKKSSYTPEEHPNTVSEIKNGSKVVTKEGVEGTFNISDEGIMSITDAEGNKTIIQAKGDAPISDAGVQLVKSPVSAELEAQARVNRPDAGTIIVNGKKYFVSLEGKTGDGLGDFVFEMDDKGRMYNTFDVNPNKDLVGQNKLDVVNSFRDTRGLGQVTEVTEALPADAEAVTSADAVTQTIAKLRKMQETEGTDKASIKEAKRKTAELLSKFPKVKFVYDNMREVLEQINTNKRFKLKGDCL